MPGLYASSQSSAQETNVSPPVLGQSETLTLVAGSVSVRLKGAHAFAPLTGSLTVPDESQVDASRGHVAVTVATATAGETAAAEAHEGRFIVHQAAVAPYETQLRLSLPLNACRKPHLGHRAGRAGMAATYTRRRWSSRRLWVSDHGGSWGTVGRYVSTSVEGTSWLTADSCHASAIKVAEGVVQVHDLIHNKMVSVTAGHEYVATEPSEEGPGYVPALGDVLTGETGGDPFAFGRQVGKHVAVFGFFGHWGAEVASLLSYVRTFRARLLLHLSTDIGYGAGAGEIISPGAIAAGRSDHYLVRLCEELSTSTAPVYIALLPEMNQDNNAYSAFNVDGSPRGSAHSTNMFRQAWRRTVLIVRGGSVATINHRLRGFRLPPLRISRSALPRPKVSFMWAPQTAGTPEIPANSPAAYFPGSAYVDIVGTDFYSLYPNFTGLERLYAAYSSKPFGFNEWAMWQNGDPGFVRQLFGFVRSHRRVALMVYNEGLSPSGPFRLTKFPSATNALRSELRASAAFLPYPPE
jgi:hypothetical protein